MQPSLSKFQENSGNAFSLVVFMIIWNLHLRRKQIQLHNQLIYYTKKHLRQKYLKGVFDDIKLYMNMYVYDQRVHKSNLTSLETRQIRGDLHVTEVFKIIKGIEKLNEAYDFLVFFPNSSTRSHPLNIYQQRSS